MSTVSANQNMAQPNQHNNSYDPSATPIKRKRGRPRKDDVPESEPNKRSKRGTALQSPGANDSLVGQEVSCSFIGVFDAGYLLTVQVGSSGPILTGMVFDPRLSVPVSPENDIAPHLPMLGRNEGIINQGAGTSQNTEFMQHIQAKESPTTSSFTSHPQTDLQLNMNVLQTASETMEPQYIPKTTMVFLEGSATETSDQNPLSEAKNENTPISASKTSNGYDPTALSLVTFSEVSKPYKSEDLNIPEVISTTAEASLDVSNEVLFDVFKEADFPVLMPSEASEIENKSSAVSDDTAFEATQVLEQKSSEKSPQRTVDESLGAGRSASSEHEQK